MQVFRWCRTHSNWAIFVCAVIYIIFAMVAVVFLNISESLVKLGAGCFALILLWFRQYTKYGKTMAKKDK